MRVVIHPYRNGRVENRCDWINDWSKVLFIKMVTNSTMYQALNAPTRLYPPRLNQQVLNWMLDD